MLSKTLALAIAIVLFVELLRDKRPRYLVSLCAGCWMLVLLLLTHPPAVLEALSLHSFLTPRFWFAHGGVTELNVGINWSTMFFLTGMMVLVEGMGEAGFFDWVSLRLARALGFRPMAILLSFMILAALLAMFVDSVTVILFLVAATVRLAQYLRFDPVPLIIGEIFAANLGGASTMTGDPPNIILGTSLGLSFWDFLQNNGIICLAGLGLALVYFYVCFHNKLKRREKGVAPELWEIDPGDAIPNHRIFRVRVGLFAAVVLLIATHTLTGLTMPSIGILAAGATLCTTKYPWGLLNGLAQVLAKLAGGHPVRTVVVLIWFVAIASAFVDNVPMAAVMVPVLLSLSDTLGMDLQTLTWTVSKGTDIGGIATPIGASANVTGVAVAAREGAPIGWKRYCKYALPASVLVLLLSMTMILLMH